jgi:HlyD family secretion protein
MRKREMLVGLLVLATVGLLSGCGGTEATETVPADAVPVVPRGAEGKVIAEAVVEPARWSELRSEGGGTAVEVPVQQGDLVSEGDVLVRFDPTDAELAVQQAEAALAVAQAQLALVQAGPRPEQIAVAEARLEVAQAALSQAAAQQDELAAGQTEADVAAAQAELASAQATQLQAENLHDRTMECFGYTLPDGTQKEFCPGLGLYEEQTRYQLHAADDALAAAQVNLEATQGGAEAQLRAVRAGVWSAVAQRDAAQARLDLVQAGSTPEDVAAAEAEVARVEASLAVARAALERTEIHAPFAGTVAEIHVEAGDTAAPGGVVVVLATLERLQVRTIDLTELDVAKVAEGQAVEVTVDALPDVQVSGHVARIEKQSVDYRGDVTYPVFIELDEDAPGLRWGMTAMVEIAANGE